MKSLTRKRKINKTKSRNKKMKVWFGGFPENAKPTDMCVKIEGDDSGIMYYMIYFNTPNDPTLASRFVYLYRVEEKERAERDLGIRFPKGF